MNTKSTLLFIEKLTTDYKTTKYCNKFPAFTMQKTKKKSYPAIASIFGCLLDVSLFHFPFPQTYRICSAITRKKIIINKMGSVNHSGTGINERTLNQI